MVIKELSIPGVFEITLSPIVDNRGFFMRSYDVNLFNQAGIHQEWVQENHSRSHDQGIIRGLHCQRPPFTETKLIRCISGAIFDVVVDLRESSTHFGKWIGVELTSDNKKMLYIPKGFAHGFCTISNISEVVYKVDNFYSKEHEFGILWNDVDLNIKWPTTNPTLSEKDKNNISFAEYLKTIKHE